MSSPRLVPQTLASRLVLNPVATNLTPLHPFCWASNDPEAESHPLNWQRCPDHQPPRQINPSVNEGIGIRCIEEKLPDDKYLHRHYLSSSLLAEAATLADHGVITHVHMNPDSPIDDLVEGIIMSARFETIESGTKRYFDTCILKFLGRACKRQAESW
jgi:hypothetical protein